MKAKSVYALCLSLLLTLSFVLSACSQQKNESSPKSAAPSEILEQLLTAQ
ncbi:hypothetical protein [Paenibacillus odorifer]|nr:hypothetical protein [Paenibacillus odorifer]